MTPAPARCGADVLVVGAGPVGLAAAIGAAERGADVILVDPRAGSVDKACGEGLMPGTLALLHELGVDPPGRGLVGIRYLDVGGAVAEHRFRDRPGRGVRRTALHDALAGRALQVGVRRVVGRVARLRQGIDVVEAGLEDGTVLRTSWVLGCDGLHSGVRRLSGLAGRRGPLRRYGLRRHAAIAPWTEHVEVYWADGVEAYVTPVGDAEVGVALLGRRGSTFAEGLAAFPALAERLDGAPWTSSVRGAGPLWQRATASSRGRVLLVGDAAGYVDAVTGEGLRVGLAGARAAVQAVTSGDASGYDRRWRAVSRDYRWLTGGLVLATAAGPVRRRLVPTASRLPAVFGAAVEALAR